MEFKSIWVCPRAAQYNTNTAAYKVEGELVKMKLRSLAPELLKELDTQLDQLLAAGVIFCSNFKWGGVPIFT